MLNSITQFFSPPIFPNDEAKTRLTRILYILATSFPVVLVIALVAIPFIFVERWISTIIILLALGLFLTVTVLAKQGHLRVGSFLYIFGAWGLIIVSLYAGNGTSGSQLGYCFAITVTAGILLGVRWAVVLAILNTLVLLAFALLEINGYPFLHLFPEPPLTRWFNFTFALFLTITPVYLVLTSLSEALSHAQQENDQRKETERLLRESEQRYRELFVNSMDGVLLTRPTGEILYANPAACDLLGYTEAELIAGGRGLVVDSSDPRLPALLTERESVGRARGELTLIRRDGTKFESEISSAIFTSPDGQTQTSMFISDITERKQLEEQLRQAQKMEVFGRLSGGIAHDFNNILIPIIGYVELAMMNMAPDDKLYPNMKRVREAAERAANLTRQILAFSRKQVLEMGILDLNTVVVGFEKMVHRLIGEDIGLEVILDADLYPIKADQGQIEQVLMNLAVNARDAMPTGGKMIIETANVYLDEAYVKKYADTLSPGPYAMLSVSDSGHGMDAETQQQIFEPFFTTKEHGKGTGLGLATVFGIVKQHGGNIWVYSELDRGTTLKVYLPQIPNAEYSDEMPQVEAELLSGTETILVVEDEEMVRKLVCETLASYGYNVIEAQNGDKGLKRVAEYKETIHLLLTDVIMPEMNGRELYKNVSTIHPTIRVLYMSGYTDNVIGHHGILEEGINFLQKPFTIHSLTQKVRQVLS